MTVYKRSTSSNLSPVIRALLFLLLAATAWWWPTTGIAADLSDQDAIPHIDSKARDNYYQLFLNARQHRAFAIAPGGSWGWTQEEDSAESAAEKALAICQEHTEQTCVLYALDDKVVFDREAWQRLWGPYSKSTDTPAEGIARGERFPDITFVNAQGEPSSIADLRGKIVLVHFWGSWCPPCLRELPTLNTLNDILRDRLDDDVVLVMLQMRESINVSRKWIKQVGFTRLPLSDSGATAASQEWLTLSDKSKLPDRHVARVFPSSYVLDRNGVVVFAHTGPIPDWTEYLPFFEDAAACSRH